MFNLTPVSPLRVVLLAAIMLPGAATAGEPSTPPGSEAPLGGPTLGLPSPSGVPAKVTVTLASGRKFTAAVDAATDDTTLWLRFEVGSSMLLRGVAWDRVTGAEYQGRPLTTDALRKLVPQLRSGRADEHGPGRGSDERSGAGPRWNLRSRRPASLVGSSQGAQAGRDQQAGEPGRIQTIQAEASVAHWGPNTEVDGIRLAVWPLDEAGRIVPVSGSLDVELIGDQRSHVMPQRPDLREQFSRLGRWTEALLPPQFTRGGPAVFRLPFQTIHPEFDPLVDNYALLRVRLAVPGAGVFETSVSDLRIRPIDNLRDRIENSTGRRFLPYEQTGRGTMDPSQP